MGARERASKKATMRREDRSRRIEIEKNKRGRGKERGGKKEEKKKKKNIHRKKTQERGQARFAQVAEKGKHDVSRRSKRKPTH